MFSSAAERDKWGPRFDSPPSTSAAASQANATGRKRKANFSNDETETLVWNVVRHFSALYGSESFRAHPVRRKQLWTQIQSRVNFLGYTERSIDDLKHKWRDLRLDVKKKITAKKPLPVHRPGPPHKPRLTPLEKMVASTFLQPTHDSEPEIVLDPESGPELRTSEMSAISPPLRNESLVSYGSMSEEEEREGPEVDGGVELQPGLDSQLSAEEDVKVSGRQAMLIRRCNSQGSAASLPEDPLNPMDAHSDWGHEGASNIPTLGRALNPSQPEEEEAANQSAEISSLPRGLMGSAWEKQEEEQQSRSPLHIGALTEESLPSSASPQMDQAPASHSLPRGLGCSRLREGRRATWRTNIHRLMDMEDQWDQLYHQELAMWQEERAQQRDERARDRELQFRLLGILTDIRDELRCLRQERAAARRERATARQERASQTITPAAVQSPATLPPESQETAPEPAPLFFPLKSEAGLSRPPPVAAAGRGETGIAARSPHGIPRRGRGRPRGSTSRHRRLFMTNS
ncbi:uncharacterized protein [Tiliqua scincoides]|uniref:uncharacterized protein isoform X3 n=1 Tax=Tiliqua scincoides TaxID=71010 RepID=UPI003462E1CE